MAFHGGMDKDARQNCLEKFKRSRKCIIFATDLLAHTRSDFTDISFVVNFDLPHKLEGYVHRFGPMSQYSDEGEQGIIHMIAEGDTEDLEGIKGLYNISVSSETSIIPKF